MIQLYRLQVLFSSSLKLVIIVVHICGVWLVPIICVKNMARIFFKTGVTAGELGTLRRRRVGRHIFRWLSLDWFDVFIDILRLPRLLLQPFIVRFRQQIYIFVIFMSSMPSRFMIRSITDGLILLTILLVRLIVLFLIISMRVYLILILHLVLFWVVLNSAVINRFIGLHQLLFLKILVLFYSQLSSFFFILVFLMFPHIQRLMMFPGEFFLSSQFIANCFVDSGSTASSLDICGIKIPHIGLLECYSILTRIFLRTFQHPRLFYFRMIELILIMFSSWICEVFLSRGYFRRILFRFAVVPGSIRQVALFVEWTCFVVGQLVVVHNKIMKRYSVGNMWRN